MSTINLSISSTRLVRNHRPRGPTRSSNNYYRRVYDRKLFRILMTDARDIINNNDKTPSVTGAGNNRT